MKLLELFKSAMLAIRTNKSRSVLTTIGIVIGVAAVITLVAIGSGLQKFVTQQFQSLGSEVVFIQPGRVNLRGGGGRPTAFTPKFTFDDVRALNRLGGAISGASSSIFKSSLAEYKRETLNISINGVGANFPELQNVNIASGRWFTESQDDRALPVILVGAEIPEKLLKNEKEPIGKQIVITDRKFTIIGVMKKVGGGFGGSNDNIVYMPINTARQLLGEKTPGSITVKAKSSDSVDRSIAQINQYFKKRSLTADDYTVLKPTQILETIQTFLGTITAALTGIAAISLIVGGVGIANIMLVSVTERTREIGLRKALGAKRADILLQFLIEAVVLSAFGGLVGIALGWGLALLLSKFVETSVSLMSVGLAFGISCAVGVISGFTPALRASRLNPIDALRYE